MDDRGDHGWKLLLFEKRILKQRFISFGIVVLLVFSAYGIFLAQKTVWPVTENHFYELGRNPGYIPSGDSLRPLILGFDRFVADLFWLRAVQYAGGNAGAFQFNALPEYIDLVTDLDPHFTYAYRFGALVYPLNQNIMHRVPELLEKGIANNRQSDPEAVGQMYVDLGFYTYFYEQDYEKAADYYEHCFQNLPECPPYARNVAAFLRAKTGRHEIALNIWLEKMASYADNPEQVTDEEMSLAQRKIEESAKLVALTCAANRVLESGGSIDALADLLGRRVNPCPAFASLSQKHLAILALYADDFDLVEVTPETLASPFEHNPFEWDTESQQVTARFWQ